MTDVMTVEHPKWGEFIDRLSGPEGCHFHRKNVHDPKSATWTCSARPDFELARPILRKMGCDVDASIAYFREHGGYCDCEILFNVQRSVQRRGRGGRQLKKRRVRAAPTARR